MLQRKFFTLWWSGSREKRLGWKANALLQSPPPLISFLRSVSTASKHKATSKHLTQEFIKNSVFKSQWVTQPRGRSQRERVSSAISCSSLIFHNDSGHISGPTAYFRVTGQWYQNSPARNIFTRQRWSQLWASDLCLSSWGWNLTTWGLFFCSG